MRFVWKKTTPGINRMSFFPDLEFGNYIQAQAVERMGFKQTRVMQGKFDYYDMVGDRGNGIEFFEFKADRRAAETGNLAIEFCCSGKKSGIWKTTADFWVHCVVRDELEDIYCIPVSVLKEMIFQNKFLRVAECDNGKNGMFLFPKEMFNEWKL